NADTGDDLLDIINKELFPYLKSFKSIDEEVKSIKYKIGAIFEFLDNCISSGHTLRDVINEIDELNFNKNEDLYQLSQIYENLLKEMG
ncbi:SAM-dependent DNA methyltransferase, partial [Francisella tularensis subsp. holarctica]|nr:SAM-dependent DNA methyltransferase [Francisella tularensis subsp. holarctica]